MNLTAHSLYKFEESYVWTEHSTTYILLFVSIDKSKTVQITIFLLNSF